MSMTPVYVLALAAVILSTAFRLVSHAFFSPLAKIPNAHWSAPLCRFWILRVRFTGRENRTLHHVHRRLGPVVRVAPNELSISDIPSVRTVYQGGFDKPDWYSVFDNYGMPCMFSALGSREHTARKKMISNVYSKTHVQSSPAAAAQARHILYERLLPVLLRSMSKSQKPYGIDVYSLMMAAAMDFITAYIFGASNGTNFLLGRSERTHFLELYQSRNDYGIYDQELPRLTAWCRKLGIPLYPWFVDYANTELAAWNKKLCEKTSHFYETTGQDCASPLAGSADEPEVWQSLMKGMRKEKDTKGLHSALSATALTNPSLTVYSEITDHILAGHETTGIALTYLTWRLSQNPALQADLRHELLTLQPTACLTDGVHAPAALPDVRQLDGLPLLHAVLQETLRLHAPIPGAQPRQTPALFCALGPYAGIHAGVRVAATAYTLHRDERVFPDPEVWDPRRWLAAHATEDERRERNRQFWAFGSGGRMCIGSHFAMQEMKLITALIYSNFTTHIVDDSGMDEQTDGYMGRPASEALYLRFETVGPCFDDEKQE